MISETIHNLLRATLTGYGAEVGTIAIDRPTDPAHGDYASSVALAYCKTLSLSPRALAEKIVADISKNLPPEIAKLEIAGPGFINFFFSDTAIQTENTKEKIALKTIYSGKKILVEHSSPNLFKPFHIGHLMNNITGEFVARATKAGGGEVTTMSFPSDVSLGIAKAIYVLNEDMKEGKDVFALPDEEKIVALGEAYRRGVLYFDEHPEEISKAKEIARVIYDKTHASSLRDLFEKTKTFNTEYLIRTIKDIGSVINETIFESEAGERGTEIVLANTGEGKVFTKSEGAIVYIPDEARKDLHTQVFINSEGHPTYEAKDLGLIDIKFSKFSPDCSYFITDAEQIPHFKIVLDAASKLGGAWGERVEKSTHVPHGRMLLKGQKMSSRLGGVPLALDIISFVKEEVRERAGEKIAHLTIDERAELEHEIALSALRVAVLRSKPGININFDPESSLSFEGDSGPYLLYTHARSASLLEKGRTQGVTPAFQSIPVTSLERLLAAGEAVCKEAVEELAPQKITTYLFEVAQQFNGLYANTQFLSDDKERSAHYLAITERVRTVLREGLWILGVAAPDRM